MEYKIKINNKIINILKGNMIKYVYDFWGKSLYTKHTK